jgi:hypothetical protein
MASTTYVVLVSGDDDAQVSTHLQNKHEFKRYAILDEVKNEVTRIYGVERKLLNTDENLIYYHGGMRESSVCLRMLCFIGVAKTVDQLLLSYFKERRIKNNDYWIDKIIRKINGEAVERAVISAWQFSDEFRALVDASFLVDTWQIIHPSHENKDDGLTNFQSLMRIHISKDHSILNEVDRIIHSRFDFDLNNF